MRKTTIMAVLAGTLTLSVGHASAATLLIDLTIQSNTVDGFQFSLIHSADDGGSSGSVLSLLAGSMRIALNDQGTPAMDDDTIAIVSFDGTLSGGDLGLDGTLTLDGPSLLSFADDANPSLLGGSMNLMADFGAGDVSQISFAFDPVEFTSLANRVFGPGADVPGTGLLAGDQYAMALWGVGSVTTGDAFGDSQIGLDLVAVGTVVPAPASLALLGIAGPMIVRRRRG